MVLNNHRIFDPRNPENAEGMFSREDDDGKLSPSTRSTATQGFSNNSATSQSPATGPHGTGFMGDLPMRNQQIGPTHMVADMGAPQAQHEQSFVDDTQLVNGPSNINTSGPGGLGVDVITSPHDLSRRSTAVFTDYSNVQGNGLYPPQWQSGTTAPSAHGLYAQPHAHPQTFVTPGVSATQQQQQASYLSNVVDGRSYEGPKFRGDLQQPQVTHQQQSYTYVTNDGRPMGALPGVSEVTDHMARGHM